MPSILTRIIAYIMYGGRSRLRPYERACLERWKQLLSTEALAILERQLERFEFIQRQSKDKLVMFSCLGRSAYANWPENALFPRRNEAVAARILLSVGRERRPRKLKADIELYDGRFFAIVFDRPPSFRGEVFAINSANVLCDPMVTATEMSQKDLLEQVDATVPDDYSQLLEERQEMAHQGVSVLHPSEIWRMPRPDRNYYVLAQVGDIGEIAVAQGGEPELYYLDHEDDEARPVGTSFREAVRTVLGSNKDKE